MMKNCLLVVALLSLALAGGCAKGGNGEPPPTISVADGSIAAIYPNQSVTFTASVGSPPAPVAVTWSLSGTSCSGNPNPCGTIDSSTGVYQAPATVPTSPQITITATATSNSAETGSLNLPLVDITTEVAPITLSVGSGLTQQFTAVALPDDAPQTFTWTCTASGVPCVNFVQDSNVSGLAYYTAQDKCSGSCVQISAASTLDPTGCVANPKYCTIAKASLVTSRVNGTYAFQFSGYDSSNNATAVVGTFTASNGTITSGAEDELTSNGPASYSITGGSYKPTSSDTNNSNNAGTLTLTLPAGTYPNQYQVVLDGAGDIEMIESDGQGAGSGVAQKSASSTLVSGDQTYAFGFTGVDSSGGRVGFVGVLPMNGSGGIVGGQVDVNDNGTANSYSSVTGSYQQDSNISELWHVTGLTLASGTTLDFDFFVASGTTSKANPLTFYAISTDAVGPTHPAAVSGTMVLQDSTQTYNIAAFKGTSVSALTGVNGANTNVSLTLGTTDGSGDFSGEFDQNNAGAILSSVQFPGASQSPSPYTYTASSSTNGRYIFQMLGNPSATPVVAPLPFVLYASGANRGFLLDQSSSSVMAGSMSPEGKTPLGALSNSEFPGTYAAATTSSANSSASPMAANLLFTSLGVAAHNVSGTEYPGPQTVSETYALTPTGTVMIAPVAPATTPNYVAYVLGTVGCTGTPSNPNPACSIQSFLMMDEDKTNPNASIIFAQQ
jgi:hypothetical protein